MLPCFSGGDCSSSDELDEDDEELDEDEDEGEEGLDEEWRQRRLVLLRQRLFRSPFLVEWDLAGEGDAECCRFFDVGGRWLTGDGLASFWSALLGLRWPTGEEFCCWGGTFWGGFSLAGFDTVPGVLVAAFGVAAEGAGLALCGFSASFCWVTFGGLSSPLSSLAFTAFFCLLLGVLLLSLALDSGTTSAVTGLSSGVSSRWTWAVTVTWVPAFTACLLVASGSGLATASGLVPTRSSPAPWSPSHLFHWTLLFGSSFPKSDRSHPLEFFPGSFPNRRQCTG